MHLLPDHGAASASTWKLQSLYSDTKTRAGGEPLQVSPRVAKSNAIGAAAQCAAVASLTSIKVRNPRFVIFDQMMLEQIQMVFFDAAGTLFEVRGSVGQIYSRLARGYGVEVAPEEIQRGFAQQFRRQPPMAFPRETPEAERLALEREWWRDLVRAVFAGEGEFPRFEEYFTEVFEFFRRAQGWRLYDDVVPTLAALKARGMRLGIISNFDSRLFDVLRALSLDHYFEAVHISSREGAAKPDPAIFRAALTHSALPPDAALHIGDNLCEDVKAAMAVAMHAVWLDRYEHSPKEVSLPRITQLNQLVGQTLDPRGFTTSREAAKGRIEYDKQDPPWPETS